MEPMQKWVKLNFQQSLTRRQTHLKTFVRTTTRFAINSYAIDFNYWIAKYPCLGSTCQQNLSKSSANNELCEKLMEMCIFG